MPRQYQNIPKFTNLAQQLCQTISKTMLDTTHSDNQAMKPTENVGEPLTIVAIQSGASQATHDYPAQQSTTNRYQSVASSCSLISSA
jgi:hypothetical protein